MNDQNQRANMLLSMYINLEMHVMQKMTVEQRSKFLNLSLSLPLIGGSVLMAPFTGASSSLFGNPPGPAFGGSSLLPAAALPIIPSPTRYSIVNENSIGTPKIQKN